MKTTALFIFASLAWARASQAQFSHHLLKVQQYSQQENEAVVKQFQGLRLTDVTDALDVAGLADIMMMDTGIRPMWQDKEKFTHRIYGVAVTVRFVPAQERPPVFANREDYYKWYKAWGNTGSSGMLQAQPSTGPGLTSFLTKDTVLVIDASRTREFGICGSANAYGWLINGMRGIVTDGGCRDSDEMILEGIPVYHRGPARGVNQGRRIVESWNTPVNVGGVLVMPGDIIVADFDGVVVVPRAKAAAVAAEAHSIQERDKGGRRKMYEKLGRPADFTVLPER